MSTTGATADPEFAAGAAVELVAGVEAGAGGAGTAAWRVTWVRVTVDTVVALGAAVLAGRVVCRVVVAVVVVAGADGVSAAGAVLVSGATGVASVTGGGAG